MSMRKLWRIVWVYVLRHPRYVDATKLLDRLDAHLVRCGPNRYGYRGKSARTLIGCGKYITGVDYYGSAERLKRTKLKGEREPRAQI